jgi:hypothetical protein
MKLRCFLFAVPMSASDRSAPELYEAVEASCPRDAGSHATVRRVKCLHHSPCQRPGETVKAARVLPRGIRRKAPRLDRNVASGGDIARCGG